MFSAIFFTTFDWAILFAYFIGIIILGLVCWKRNNSADQFTAGGRSLPGWLCGLSIFATYLSSISYLALPGKAFVENWNSFVFSLTLPITAAIAVRFFLPMYRKSGEVSAYSLLEKRFGLWARIFASSSYLLFHIARIGVVMYLMALPMAVLFGWDMRIVILVTGLIVTAYAFIGGIVAVIWADAIQAIVLLSGAFLALGILLFSLPGGAAEVIALANQENKFSLGDSSLFLFSEPTIWVVFAFGIFENLRNFGIDQSYVQRYIAAKSDREAARSIWIGALLYVPVSALFFFIGTSLFTYYQTHGDDHQQLKVIVAEQKLMLAGTPIDSPNYQKTLDETVKQIKPNELGDRAFPHFIASQLPQGARGLLIAAIFAAAMSTVSTSLNSSATLVMSDFYQRLFVPKANDKQLVAVLRIATIVWGVLGTLMALALVRLTDSALDIWWLLSSTLGAGVVGLFLLGLINRRINGKSAVTVLVLGMLVIAWMVLSKNDIWPESWSSFASPFHKWLTIVIGPLVILALGWLVTFGKQNSITKTPPLN